MAFTRISHKLIKITCLGLFTKKFSAPLKIQDFFRVARTSPKIELEARNNSKRDWQESHDQVG